MQNLYFKEDFYNVLFNDNCFDKTGKVLEEFAVILTIDRELNIIRTCIDKQNHARDVMYLIEEMVIKYGLYSKIKNDISGKRKINVEFYKLFCIYWVRLLFVSNCLDDFLEINKTFLRWSIESLQAKYFSEVIVELVNIDKFVKCFEVDLQSKQECQYVDYTANNYVFSETGGFPLTSLVRIICQSILGRFIIEGNLNYNIMIDIIDEEMENLYTLITQKKFYSYNYLIIRNIEIEEEFNHDDRKIQKMHNVALFDFFSDNNRREDSLYFYRRRYVYEVNPDNDNLHELSYAGNINSERAISEILFSLIIRSGNICKEFLDKEFYVLNSVSIPYSSNLNNFKNDSLRDPKSAKLLLPHELFENYDLSNTNVTIVLSRIKSWVSSNSTESRLINIVILWETLLGSNSEISFKISFSIAKILTLSNGRTLQENHEVVKKIYKTRSEIIHGAKDVLRVHREIEDDVLEAEEITITVLKYIYNSKLLDKSSRDRFESIIFSD